MILPFPAIKDELKTFLGDAQQILKNQTIDENNPGTILKDFNTFLNLVKNQGIEVSGKNS